MWYCIHRMVHKCWTVKGNTNMMHGMYNIMVIFYCLGCYMFRLFCKTIVRHMHKIIRESEHIIYIYIYVCVCVCVCEVFSQYTTVNWPVRNSKQVFRSTDQTRPHYVKIVRYAVYSHTVIFD